MKAYLLVAAALPSALVGGIAVLNYAVDPYLLHQWDNPRVARLRPAQEKLGAWGKAYAVAAYQPDTIYLGNSRTELGLPVPAGGGQRTFNAALSGATLGDAIRILQHAVTVGPLRRVVWGIDAPSFTLSPGNLELQEPMLASGQYYLAGRRLLDLQRAVALDMTAATLAELTGKAPLVCQSSLARFGQRDGACLKERLQDWGGARAVAPLRVGEFIRAEGPAPQAMAAFEQALRRHCALQWRVYVNPTHAMTIDAYHYAGKQQQLDQWLAGLAAAGQRLRQAGCDVRIYDFSGFNSVTMEALPAAGREMQRYWEASHYRDNVGQLILARLAGAAPHRDGFGAELLPATVAGHIARRYAARGQYHALHAADSATARTAALNRSNRNTPPQGKPATCCR